MRVPLPFLHKRPRNPTREEMDLAKLVVGRMSLEELDAIGIVARSDAIWPGLRSWCWMKEKERGPE